MIPRKKLLDILRGHHALQRGHFELSSGLHSGHYFQCAQLLQHPKIAAQLCQELARRFRTAKPSIVIGPAIGGVLVAYETARALGVRAMYTERVDAEIQLRRGFHLTSEDRVLIVEDTVTTGESARKVADLIEALGAKAVGIAAIVDRSGGRVRFPGRRYTRLLSLTFDSFPPHECPLCSEHIPVTRPGRPRPSG
ncbi:MAG TPA: orotate phosphoribosyltransferase [bacterium]